MCKLKLIFALTVAISTNIFAQEQEVPARESRFAITYNAFETLGFVAANKIFIAQKEPKLIFLPFHFDGHMKLNDKMGISFGLIYRYESYQDQGPLYSESGKTRGKKIWTDYHELFLLAGPRFSFANTGLDGFYFSMKGGLGAAYSPAYFSASLLVQPDIGYAFSFGNPGFRLDLGVGILANMAFHETVDFAVPWKKNRESYGAIGVLVHQAVPVLNVGVGLNW